MKNNRSNQSRNDETTRDTSRDFYSFNQRNPLAPPPGVKRDGYVLRWVNTSIRGIDEHKVQTARWNGWQEVPAERCSINYYGRSSNGRDPEGMIFKDVILMEREEDISIKENQYYNNIAHQAVRNLKGVSDTEEPKLYNMSTIGR